MLIEELRAGSYAKVWFKLQLKMHDSSEHDRIDPITGETLLILACKKHATNIACYLLTTPGVVERCNPAHVDKFNNTALTLASANNMMEVADLLIKTGNCSPSHVDRTNMTAMLWVCKNKMIQVAWNLLRYEKDYASLLHIGAYGLTAYKIAMENDDHQNGEWLDLAVSIKGITSNIHKN